MTTSNPNAPSSGQESLDRRLLAAAEEGDPQEIKKLLALGASARAVSESMDQATALCYAARVSRECVELLLPVSDPKHNGTFGTPLHFAAFAEKPECLEALIPHCDALARDSFGDTALMDAARGHSVRCVELLIPASDANARSERLEHQSKNAFMLAMKNHPGPIVGEIAKRLADATQDLNARDGKGKTALMAGVERALEFDWRESSETAAYEMLLGRVDANLRGNRGLTALDRAVEEHALAHVKKLLPFTDVRAEHEGKCAIDRAVEEGCWPVVDFLAPFSSREKADHAFLQAGVGDMPAWAAFLESEELQRTVEDVTRARGVEDAKSPAAQEAAEKGSKTEKGSKKRSPRSL